MLRRDRPVRSGERYTRGKYETPKVNPLICVPSQPSTRGTVISLKVHTLSAQFPDFSAVEKLGLVLVLRPF